MKALLLENIHDEAVRTLRSEGYQVERLSKALGEDELIEALDGVDLLGVRSRTNVTRRVVEARGDTLTAVGAFCIGTNQLDLGSLSEAGVAAFNAPYSNTRSVVELVLAEIIALARRLGDRNTQMHHGVWRKSASGSHEIRGRKLGIVGYGNIGSQLSVLAEAMGMRVWFYDVADKLPLGNARKCDSLEELLQTVETVSIHVDGRPENRGIIGAAEFETMRPRTLFLNLSRGGVVDVDALAENLRTGHIAGAAVDVFPTEPKSGDEPFISPLTQLDNVVLTPHVGGSTQEAQVDIGRYVANKLIDYAENASTSMSVNLPDIAPATTRGTRIGHLHHNVPGVMATLNRLIADYGGNVTYQALATRDDLGYAVLDIAETDRGLLAEVADLDATIRARVL
ncbi:phosphoglycerate dehydrogenase [Acidipropionibacterium virtanenii]|uniref:D-3-phosphoglycerate dehydrogenase n=1 Tax=Acidipropionibacterium virtanenii TaxID=2057246 RepID=A0A344UTR0_9ACTN|nr:phosphoglycerate dehydrogenase [Acidipropionibacterium virtanenii]AXE38658.1 D-3-phosphoglycerate dehydrogenase [Acidipropionibacterium virtanenii]